MGGTERSFTRSRKKESYLEAEEEVKETWIKCCVERRCKYIHIHIKTKQVTVNNVIPGNCIEIRTLLCRKTDGKKQRRG